METPIKREISVTLTPEEVGKAFANFDNEQQARVFNAFAEEAKTWKLEGRGTSGLHNFCFQMQSIIDTKLLTDDAKKVMRDIGSYATEVVY